MNIVMLASTLFVARSAHAFAPATRRAFSRSAVNLAENPKVFFDMEIGGKDAGRISFELRADVVPKTGMR